MTNLLITLSAYCACKLCCGPLAPRPTASGVYPTQGITLAAPKQYPLNTPVLLTIPNLFTNKPYVIQDRINYKGRWDLYFKSHKEALRFGVRKATVSIGKRN